MLRVDLNASVFLAVLIQLLGLLLPVDLVCRSFRFCLLNGNDKQTILTRIFLLSNGTLDITVVAALCPILFYFFCHFM